MESDSIYLISSMNGDADLASVASFKSILRDNESQQKA